MKNVLLKAGHFYSGSGTGIKTNISVPDDPESMRSVPSISETLSRKEDKPIPSVASVYRKPRPLSLTTSSTASVSSLSSTDTNVAPECLITLVNEFVAYL